VTEPMSARTIGVGGELLLGRWLVRRKALRQAWQQDARDLISADNRNAYYNAHRLLATAKRKGDRASAWHWAKVAAEVARSCPAAEMDFVRVKAIADGAD
jgi:hypothetical protein